MALKRVVDALPNTDAARVLSVSLAAQTLAQGSEIPRGGGVVRPVFSWGLVMLGGLGRFAVPRPATCRLPPCPGRNALGGKAASLPLGL